MRGLIIAAVLIAVVAIGYSFLSGKPATVASTGPAMPSAKGWEELGTCIETASHEGNATLELHPDGGALLIEGDSKTAGQWLFSEGLYSVTVRGKTTTYSRWAPEGLCMLVKGSPTNADLTASWIAIDTGLSSTQEYD